MLDVVYRKDDVVKFRRGANEYVGTIKHVSGVMHGCIVHVDGSPASITGDWTVALKSIVQIVTPVLSEKETVALHALAAEHHAGVERVSVKALRGSGPPVAGTTLHGLSRRGLVQGSFKTVTGTGPMVWALTGEGRRVARELI